MVGHRRACAASLYIALMSSQRKRNASAAVARGGTVGTVFESRVAWFPNGRPSWNGVHSPRGLHICSICDRTRPIATVGVPLVSSMCASALTARIQMGQTVSSTASIRSWRNRSLIWSAKYSAVAGSVEPITV